MALRSSLRSAVPAKRRLSFSNMSDKPQVTFKTEDRQWDGRFNVQTDEDLSGLLTAIEQHWDSGRLKYILVGGVEVGTRPFQDDYQIKHVHVAAIFHDRISKASIIKNWRVKQGAVMYEPTVLMPH